MRLTYLTIPLFALLLAGCGEEEEATFPETNTAPQTEEYGNPTDPAGDTAIPNNSTAVPPADSGAGTYGTDGDQMTDPATDDGSDMTQ